VVTLGRFFVSACIMLHEGDRYRVRKEGRFSLLGRSISARISMIPSRTSSTGFSSLALAVGSSRNARLYFNHCARQAWCRVDHGACIARPVESQSLPCASMELSASSSSASNLLAFKTVIESAWHNPSGAISRMCTQCFRVQALAPAGQSLARKGAMLA